MRTLLLLIILTIGHQALTEENPARFVDGHENDITSISISPDGKYIASGDWSGMVNIYFNDTVPDYYLTFTDHSGPINTLAFSRDSKKLLTGGQDGKVCVYSFDDSTGLIFLDTSLNLSAGHISHVEFGPGLRMIFASDEINTLYAYDIEKKKFRNIKAPGPITTFAVSIDRSSYYVAVKGSTDIIQFDPMGREKRRLTGHAGEITALALTLDRKFLISAGEDKKVMVWDIATGKILHTFSEHTWDIKKVCVDPFSAYVISCGLDGKVFVHDIRTGELLATFDNTVGRCTDVCISSDLRRIAVGLQLRSQPEDEFGYGFNVWETQLKPPLPQNRKR